MTLWRGRKTEKSRILSIPAGTRPCDTAPRSRQRRPFGARTTRFGRVFAASGKGAIVARSPYFSRSASISPNSIARCGHDSTQARHPRPRLVLRMGRRRTRTEAGRRRRHSRGRQALARCREGFVVRAHLDRNRPRKGPGRMARTRSKRRLREAAVSSRSSSIGKNGETLACASPFFRALSKGCFLSRSFRASPVERVSQASAHSPPPTPQEARAKERHPSRRRLPHGGRSRS